MAGKQRLSYVPLEKMTPEMRAEMERCAREGTPRPESSAVRAHVPGAFWAFANSWRDIFHTGVCDHAVKELCRLYVSRAVTCEFCGNQRSIKAFSGKLEEAQTDDLVNFEKSAKYSEREKAALAYAEAITWRLETDDRFWERLHAHFTRARAGGAGLLHRAHHGTAELAAAPQHRPSPGDGGHHRLDGARLRGRRRAREIQGRARLLGEEGQGAAEEDRLKFRQLGKNGPTVSAIGMGRGSQPVRPGEPLEQEFNAAIRRARDLGVNLFDSSDAYWRGRHEVLLGAAVQAVPRRGAPRQQVRKHRSPRWKKSDQRPARLRAPVLRREPEAPGGRRDRRILPAPRRPGVPIEDTVGEMGRLVERGKVRWVGICEAGVTTLKRAHATMAARRAADRILAVVPRRRARDHAGVPRARHRLRRLRPARQGAADRAHRKVEDLPENDRRRNTPRFAAENLARNVKLVERLEDMANERGVTPAQLALAWLHRAGRLHRADTRDQPCRQRRAERGGSRRGAVRGRSGRAGRDFPIGAGAGARSSENVLKGLGI